MEYGFPYFYRAVGPFTNWAEQAAKQAEDDFRKNLPEGAQMPAGLFWHVEKVERLASPAGDPPDDRDDRDYGTGE